MKNSKSQISLNNKSRKILNSLGLETDLKDEKYFAIKENNMDLIKEENWFDSTIKSPPEDSFYNRIGSKK